ncbi:MAG: nitroreductase family protein [Gaiella sp.]
MDAFLAITSRRDERRYTARPLAAELVEQILDAGRLAGSSRNRQPWVFVLPTSRERIERLAESVFVPENVLSAGLVVAILVAGRGPTQFDAGRAAQNMLLAAWNAGVASCPNGISDDGAARSALDAFEDENVSIVLSFGHPERERAIDAHNPAEWSERANRKPLDELVRRVG